MTTASDPTTDERAARIARLQATRAPQRGGSSRRTHPARGARAVALLTSVAATGGLGAALYRAEHQPVDAADAAASATALTSSAASVAAGSTTAGTATAAASTASAATATAASGTAAKATPTTTAASAAATTGTYKDGTYLGTAQYTRWGDVQVKVTISGGKITDIVTVQVPSDGKSTTINNRATPVLEAQAIATQSADLDVVSGATYTSRTYATSLQSALDQAATTKGTAA